MKLTPEQEEMIGLCIAHDIQWTTKDGGENHALLMDLERRGIFEQVLPSPHPPLVAYRPTPAGREALASSGGRT